MQLDPILRKDIQSAERCVLTAYLDTNGYWTNGWGHKLPTGHDWKDYTITQDLADRTLDSDILTAVSGAQTLVERVVCNRCRANALVELVFNMGLTKWKTFSKTRAAWQAQNWKTASGELKESLWYRQVGKTRGDRLVDYLLTGSYPLSVVASSLYAYSSLGSLPGSALPVTLPEGTGSLP